MRYFSTFYSSWVLIFCCFVGQLTLAQNPKKSKIEAEYESIKSSLNRLRNRASQLRFDKNAFVGRSDKALSSLVKNEKEDNSAVLGLANLMKKQLSEVVDGVDRKFGLK